MGYNQSLKITNVSNTHFNGCLQAFDPVDGTNFDGNVKNPLPNPAIKWLSDRQCSGNVDNVISV